MLICVGYGCFLWWGVVGCRVALRCGSAGGAGLRVVRVVGGRRSGCSAGCVGLDAGKGSGDLGDPGPVFGEGELVAAGVAGQVRGDGEDLVA